MGSLGVATSRDIEPHTIGSNLVTFDELIDREPSA